MATNRSIEALIEDWAPQLQRAFLDAVYAMRDRAQIELIAELLEKGDVDGAIRAVGLDPVSLRTFDETLAKAFEAGGRAVTDSIPALREASGHILKVLFDVRNPAAQEWLRTHSSWLITEVMADQREMIRNFLVAGMEAGNNPKTVALDLVGRVNKRTGRREGGVIGLTSSQSEWVRSYEARLRSGDPAQMRAAMEMELGDERFDPTVEKAIREGKPIPAAKITKMVEAYKNRALRYRAEVIGRTEAMTSLHEAQMQGWRQAIDRGQVKVETLVKVWASARDERVRGTHRVLNGQAIPFEASFVSPSGATLRYPGDPKAPVREIAMCRCHMTVRMDFLAQRNGR